MLSDPPTNAELERRFDRLQNSIDGGFARIDQQMTQLVTHDVFTVFRDAMHQRIAATEERAATIATKHDKDVAELRDDLEQAESQRSYDRRTMTKVAATVAIGSLTVIATLAGIFLPMIMTQ